MTAFKDFPLPLHRAIREKLEIMANFTPLGCKSKDLILIKKWFARYEIDRNRQKQIMKLINAYYDFPF